MKLRNLNYVMNLANGHHSDREGLTVLEVARANVELMDHLMEGLRVSYALLYLQSTLHCDLFHEGKNSFSDVGETYGYTGSTVRVENGTLSCRFYERRPLPTGTLQRRSIPMKSGRYVRSSFKRSAAHDYERELALMTEEQYAIMRATGKNIKTAIRKIRESELMKTYGKHLNK
ncbi:MAG TPA: hypothetical protein ENI94_13200 [Gammaproteobacteria bacterium]|nr:hypothetical protein [Gammaproteobacteria bacterium]